MFYRKFLRKQRNQYKIIILFIQSIGLRAFVISLMLQWGPGSGQMTRDENSTKQFKILTLVKIFSTLSRSIKTAGNLDAIRDSLLLAILFS